MGVGYIFTFRSEDEEELSLYYGIASDMKAPLADVEISSYAPLRAEVKFDALMLSHHSYTGESVLSDYAAIMRLHPQLVKLASEYKDYESFQSDFISLQKLKRKDGVCLGFIPMGEKNAFLRIISAYVISDIVYAKEQEETAKGQLTENEYSEFFSKF